MFRIATALAIACVIIATASAQCRVKHVPRSRTPSHINGERVVPGSLRVIQHGRNCTCGRRPSYTPAPFPYPVPNYAPAPPAAHRPSYPSYLPYRPYQPLGQLEEKKTGLMQCFVTGRIVVGSMMHTTWSDDSVPITFMCESAWQRLTPAQRAAAFRDYLDALRAAGRPRPPGSIGDLVASVRGDQ